MRLLKNKFELSPSRRAAENFPFFHFDKSNSCYCKGKVRSCQFMRCSHPFLTLGSFQKSAKRREGALRRPHNNIYGARSSFAPMTSIEQDALPYRKLSHPINVFAHPLLQLEIAYALWDSLFTSLILAIDSLQTCKRCGILVLHLFKTRNSEMS